MPRILDNTDYDPTQTATGAVDQNVVTFSDDADLLDKISPGDLFINETLNEEYYIKSVDSDTVFTTIVNLKTALLATHDLKFKTSKVRRSYTSKVFSPFYALEIGEITPGVYLRLWTGIGDLTVNIDGTDVTFNGGGTLLNFSNNYKEVSRTEATGIDIQLALTSQNILDLILNSDLKDKNVIVYAGVFDEDLDPVAVVHFNGFVDITSYATGSGNEVATISCENDIIKLSRKRLSRYTSGYQNGIPDAGFSDDRFFDFVEKLQGQRILWGV